ncbi:Protein of unknown function, partial [Gryllus bimaculatus]
MRSPQRQCGKKRMEEGKAMGVSGGCEECVWEECGTALTARVLYSGKMRSSRYAGRPHLIWNRAQSSSCAQATPGGSERHRAPPAAGTRHAKDQAADQALLYATLEVDSDVTARRDRGRRTSTRVLKYGWDLAAPWQRGSKDSASEDSRFARN